MASLNVAEWSVEQVADWLSGLGPTVARYVPALKARGLDGAKLLTLRCDDLEYLGVRVIGHQELLLEAVEHLRNFQYEASRECVQQLALRVSVVATTLARALAHHADARLETPSLADVARTVHAVKPLVCWLDRWPLCSSGGAAASLAERKAALLKLSLEAATCAQRDRFAEQPARAVAAAAAAAAATADYIIQDVSDPMILQPASLDSVTLRQGGKPLGFDVVPSFCGHHQLADIRFGSPAHASGAVHVGDEIVQVGGRCVVGWSGAAVLRACEARAGDELTLRLRRRGARAPPALNTPQLHARRLRAAPAPFLADLRLDSFAFLSAAPRPAAALAPRDSPRSSSDESEPLSPPASPSRLDRTRMFPPKPRSAVQRRHSVGESPLCKRASHTVEQFWHELKQQRSGQAAGGAGAERESPDVALYARDKAQSCSTGLQLAPAGEGGERGRGRLDKSHSTPAYDQGGDEARARPPAAQPIPESPPADSPPPPAFLSKADRILEFKRSSSQIGEAILQQRVRRDTDEPAASPDRRRRPPPREPPGASVVLRAVPRPPASAAPPRPARPLDAAQISLPLRHLTKHDICVVAQPRRELPALNGEPEPPAPRRREPVGSDEIVVGAAAMALSPGSGARSLFPTSKSRSLKKKSSILAKRRLVPLRALAARGACGGAWQRVRARGAAAARWARRQLLLAHGVLYAYRAPDAAKADCMICLEGFTASAAPEVKSRAHAFKVYHTGRVFYFACDSRDAMLAWIQLIHRATLLPAVAARDPPFSETDYSDESDDGARDAGSPRARAPEPLAATSLDRKYLRFFSRKTKDDAKLAKAQPEPVHASNPNLAELQRLAAPAPRPRAAPEEPAGFVTLEQFMLRKQAEERRQVYSNRVLMGVEHDQRRELQRRLENIVPDVIYGEVSAASALRERPVSVRGKDGYEKIVFPDEGDACSDDGRSPPHERWRDSLRRNDKVHTTSEAESTANVKSAVQHPPLAASHNLHLPLDSWSGAASASASAAGPGVSRLRLMFGGGRSQRDSARQPAQYPHLQCPPTFQPETYSLARPPPASPRGAP